jgi:formylglycine-generating enzyme required for sulfatase activity/aminoglycoside phosphotransferase (APT) family kinase protein
MLAPNSILQNRYRVVRLLSEGGMGSVYEAIDQRVSCVVALKRTTIENKESLRAFEREAALLANLRHPSLPKVMDYFCEDGGEFLVMEFIPGNDLAELLQLRGGPFSQDQVLRWADDLLQLLEHLHGLEPPILHRDIKPANLKLTKQGEIFLLDFGLAKGAAGQMRTLQTSKSVRGYTPVYSPLEQIHGEGTDARSDVYALGATLYHLLGGRAPIDAPKRFIAVDDNMPDPLRPVNRVNPNVSDAVSHVIRQAMAIRRRDRFDTATAMRAALRRAREIDQEVETTTRDSERAQPVISHDPEARTGLNKEEFSTAETIKADGVSEPVVVQWSPPPATPQKSAEPIKTIHAVFADIKAVPPRPREESASNEATRQFDSFAAQVDSEPNDIVEPVPNESRAYAPRPNYLLRSVVLSVVALVLVGFGIGLILLWKGKTNNEPTTGSVSQQPVAPSTNTSVTTAPPKQIVAPVGMIYIPGGQFTMGRNNGDEYERPAHHVTVKPFFIDIDEVTNQQYQEFVDKTGHSAPTNWNNKHFPNGEAQYPVTDVNWDDATAYSKWAHKRLPSEEEWEFAARGTDGRLYPWGNDWQSGLSNVGTGNHGVANVGSYKGASPFGVLDLIGNAWEWTSSKLAPYPDGKIAGVPAGDMRVIRGGSFESDQNSATTTFRRGYPARGQYEYKKTGFRCAKDTE